MEIMKHGKPEGIQLIHCLNKKSAYFECIKMNVEATSFIP
jgi:hypothetical protein